MASPDQNKANVKAFYDLAFNQRQPEQAVKQNVGSSYRQHNPMAGVAGGSGKGRESKHDVLACVVS
jgi:predicted SnoaL-like aldol condensation-catalyzing enzyme